MLASNAAPNKACPVVLRLRENQPEILVLRHPRAGSQLVKGTIEPAESLADACTRELWEESGLHASAAHCLGRWEAGFEGQIWGFFLMRLANRPPDSWDHFTTDGGGHLFNYFWQPLASPPGQAWHPLFQQALAFIKHQLTPEHLTIIARWQATWPQGKI